MNKINKHIQIVSSTKSGLGSMNKESREAIRQALSNHYDNVGITIVNNLFDLELLVAKQPDLVFLGTKFVYANKSPRTTGYDKIWVNEYLNEQGIACTGSSSSAHKLDVDKPLAKQCVVAAGFSTSAFIVAKSHQELAATDLPMSFPLFVKPTDCGGGQGIDSHSVVHTAEQLQAKVEQISRDLGSDSLIEQYLPGREFSVAVMKHEHSPEYLIMPIELCPPEDDHGSRLLSRNVKSFVPLPALEVQEKDVKTAVCDLAINSFQAIGARDYGRIDIRLDQHGVPHFLEANLVPSLIKNYGSFPKACILNADMEYEKMLLRIVRLGIAQSDIK